ncbi:MAG: ABC transporter ATP-binding protein [Candidatus Hodarchaeales archaeon]
MSAGLDTKGYAIEVNNLSKKFGKGDNQVEAVKNLSLRVKKGEIFGFLGPNGAGKTTSLRMIVGLLKPDTGSVRILGLDPRDKSDYIKIKRIIGIIPQEISLYQELTVEENLLFIASAYRIEKNEAKERVNKLITSMGLGDKRRALVKTLSGGLKRRLNLIMGLVHDPQIVLCDEPTPGLDPQSRVVVWEYLQNLPKEGKTVILTTHFMEEADRLSDRVAIIDHGSILVLDTPKELKASIGEGDLVELVIGDGEKTTQLDKIAESLKQFNGGKTIFDVRTQEKTLIFRALDVIPKLSKILNVVEEHGVNVENMAIRSTTLEDVFIHLTGRALRN